MKTIKILAAVCIAATTLFTASCSKDANVNPGGGNPGGGNPDGSTMKVARIEQDANNYMSFTYDGDGKVTSFANNDEGTLTTAAITYDGNKKPIAITMGNELYKISYNGNQIDRLDMYTDKNNTTTPDFYNKYIYTNGKITEVDGYTKMDANFVVVLKTVNAFNADGDITSQKMYTPVDENGALTLYSTTNYEYDNKKNPLKEIFDFTSILMGAQSVHNANKVTTLDAANNITETDTYAITYNNNGYPTQVQMTAAKPGQPNSVTVSKFTYK